jgi:hypothetical protein
VALLTSSVQPPKFVPSIPRLILQSAEAARTHASKYKTSTVPMAVVIACALIKNNGGNMLGNLKNTETIKRLKLVS